MTDPIEKIVADALYSRGVEYVIDGTGETCGLDFRLVATDVYIECKAYHTPRTSEQMARVENIIVIQGKRAAETFAALLTQPKRE